MCGPEVVAGAQVLGAIAGVAGAVSGMGANKDAKEAAAQQKKQAEATLTQNQREQNRLNAKSPNTEAIVDANARAAKGGSGSTMLTGPSGVDPSLLTLGKNTLLGTA